MQIAHIFHEGELTLLEKNCIKSFVCNNFKVKLWSYTPHQLPNVELCDASIVLDRNIDIKQDYSGKSEKETTLAAFSDYFRYKVVSMYGGWWFDSDCFCLKDVSEFEKLIINKDIISCKQNDDYEDKHHIACGAFWANEIIAKKLIHDFEGMLSNINYGDYVNYGLYGPEFFTNFVKRNGLYDMILHHKFFYAIRWYEMQYMTNSELLQDALELTKDSYLTHIWNSHIPIYNIDKNNPPKGSFLEYLYKKNI
jgi:hypothetical protein